MADTNNIHHQGPDAQDSRISKLQVKHQVKYIPGTYIWSYLAFSALHYEQLM